jgi:enamine deaminase RidA (YjgF/YER057c/UK114 family)
LNPEKCLNELGITLGTPPAPVANYQPAVRTGNLLFISGQSCIVNNRALFNGKVGRELTPKEGYEAARIATVNCLAIIKATLGSLDRVKRVVKLFGIVNSAPGFNEQPGVINGASDLLVQIFGENGAHARTAVGTNELPSDLPVEVEMIVEIKA